jgi:hypothetical protein
LEAFIVQTTVFSLVDGQVEPEICEVPPWADPDEFGQVAAELNHSPNGTTVPYRIPAGRTVPIHAGPNFALCQIISAGGRWCSQAAESSIIKVQSCLTSSLALCTVGVTS